MARAEAQQEEWTPVFDNGKERAAEGERRGITRIRGGLENLGKLFSISKM